MENSFLQSQTANTPKKKPAEESPVEKPQAEAEQSPAENSAPAVEAVKKYLTKERRKQTIEIEFEGLKFPLETESYEFEYPEQIQKETGILGYERTKISNESLFNFWKEYCSKKNSLDFEEHGIKSEDDLVVLADSATKDDKGNFIFKDNLEENPSSFNGKRYADFLNKHGNFDPYEFENDKDALHRELLSILSNGEYPNHCLNHVLGLFKHSEDSHDNLNKKFFLQKIYDFNSIEKSIATGVEPEHVFNQYGDFPDSNFNLYDNETGQKIIAMEYIGKITEYKNLIEEKKAFAATLNGGLYLQGGQFYNPPEKSEVCLGFPASNDGFLNEYLTKTLESYYKLDPSHDSSLETILTRGAVFAMYLWSQYSKFAPILKSANKNSQDKKTLNYLSEIEAIGSNFFKERGWEDLFQEYSKGLYPCDDFMFNREFRLPIFIGHPEIPQLSWGHAKYAHYMNEKGLNFFKFKHAEHLPEPRTGNSKQ